MPHRPYLPVNLTEDTEFPEAWGKDLRHELRMIEERYHRHFPEIDYYQMKKAATPTIPPAISGEPANTQFDPLWAESVDPNMATWQQPHLSGTLKAADVDVFFDPVPIHARLQRENLELELKKYGFDQVRDLLVFVPLTFFDSNNIAVSAGDKFVWDDDEYRVLQFDRTGFWKNTNLRIYMAINAEHLRAGG